MIKIITEVARHAGQSNANHVFCDSCRQETVFYTYSPDTCNRCKKSFYPLLRMMNYTSGRIHYHKVKGRR